MHASGTWIAAEPRLAAELRGVLARAVRRPLLVLGLAVLGTSLAAGFRATRKPSYLAMLTLRMAEGDMQDPRNSPRPPARIREYVSDVALTRERVLRMMEKHGLHARLRQNNPEAAVEALREDIDIDVVRNYFLLDRQTAGEPRSVQVVLSYRGDDRAQALAVVQDIGAAVLESQAATRSAQLSQETETNALQRRRARGQLGLLQEQQAALLLRQAAGAPEDLVAVVRLQVQINGALVRVQELEKRAAALDLAREAEKQRLGLTFQLVDENVRALRRPADAASTARYGLLVLALALPICAILVGGFDQRIHRASDVTARQFPLLGAIPAFPGSDGGAYRSRCERAPESRPPTS